MRLFFIGLLQRLIAY